MEVNGEDADVGGLGILAEAAAVSVVGARG